MAAFKFQCPGCSVRMVAPEKLPAKLTCPRCRTKFTLSPDGKTALRGDSAVAREPAGNGSSPSVTGEILRDTIADARKPDTATTPSFSRDALAEREPEPTPSPNIALPEKAPSFLQRLHTLPKPILFGIYGAVGGLLGVLLLGELCLALIQPKTKEKPPIRLAMHQEVTVYHGGKNAIPVSIDAQGIDGPVILEVLGLPKDVSAARTVVLPGATEAEIDIAVGHPEAVGVRPRSLALKLKASSEKQPKKSVEQPFNLMIEPLPRRVMAAYPAVVQVYPSDKNIMPVKIARHGFAGLVRLELAGDLPAKVSVESASISGDKTESAVAIAVKDVPFGEYPVKLRAVPEDTGADSAIIATTVKVVPVPPIVQLAVPPSVVVYSGGKNRFGVKIARQRFEGPVHITLADGPPGVQFAPVTIAAGATEATAELSAPELPSTQSILHQLRFQAQGPEESITASAYLQLKVEPLPPSLQVATSPKFAVYAGDKGKFLIKIARHRFSGPVRVEAIHLPGHVALPGVTVSAEAGEAEMQAVVGNEARIGPLMLQLQAKALGEKPATTIGKLDLDVVPMPTNLRMTVSPQVEVYQVGKCRFTVKVARAGFTGAVNVEFADLPAGVTFPVSEIPSGVDEAVVEGFANAKAALGKHKVTATAKGGPGYDGKDASSTAVINLEVKKSDKKPPPLDIMFVLDVTGSMQPQINGVRDGIGQFINELDKTGLEARVGMVAFRDIIFDKVNPIQLLRFNKEVFTTDFKLFSKVVGALKEGGGGDEPESSLEGMVTAANQAYRKDALKILLLITDAGPQTILPSISMAKAVQILKDKKIDQVHLIIPRRFLNTYEALQKNSKGTFFDLHEATRNKKGFAAIMPEVSKAIARVSVAAGPEMPLAEAPPPLPAAKDAPVLPQAAAPPPPPVESARTPPPVDAPPPLVNAVASPPKVSLPSSSLGLPSLPKTAAPGLPAVQSDQTFDEKDQYQLLFAIALWTSIMAAGIGLILVGGQKFYLRKAWLSWSDTAKATGASMAAGFAGGFVSQWFFQSTAGGAWWGAISRLVAWTLLGGLLGGGLGLFVPNLAKSRAFLGGCLGGLLGAIGFVTFTFIFGEVIGRWLGAAILGFFIGMMIALSELAFRRYWLEITYGAREVRTVTLGTAPVAVGSADASAVFVQGAPALACRYWMEENRVLLEDSATGAIAEIQPGERRELAGVSIAVCSAASAQTAGVTLRLSHGSALTLTEGLPLTAGDIPGLEPQGEDGLIALVSRRPSDPKVLLLRNRSKQTWTLTDAAGNEQQIRPGLGLEIAADAKISFGAVRGVLVGK